MVLVLDFLFPLFLLCFGYVFVFDVVLSFVFLRCFFGCALVAVLVFFCCCFLFPLVLIVWFSCGALLGRPLVLFLAFLCSLSSVVFLGLLGVGFYFSLSVFGIRFVLSWYSVGVVVVFL